MRSPVFEGCGTALITPFRRDLAVDVAALRQLVRFQIEQGIDFLVPGGTTGESATLTRDEHIEVVRIVVEEARAAKRRRVAVLAGAGGNNTAAVIELARAVQDVGADGILSVAPYYNKPTQEGLYQHFAATAKGVSIPVVLYNVPGRTASNIEPATVARLAQIENITGIKEASGNLVQIARVIEAAPKDFSVLSGDDALTLPLLAIGGRGLISVAANEIPGEMSKMIRLALQGDYNGARALHYRYLALMEINFVESNPIPVKAVMSRMGFCEEVYRLPLVPLSAGNRAKIEAVIESLQLGLIGAKSATLLSSVGSR